MSSEPIWSTSSVRAVWRGGVQSDTFVREFPPMLTDEPPTSGGADQGPRPTEYLLTALTGATMIHIERAAKAHGYHLEAAAMEVSGTLDQRGVRGVDDTTPCFQIVSGTIRLWFTPGPQVDLGAVRAMVERRCPVQNTLRKAGARIELDWVLQSVSGQPGRKERTDKHE